jgi:glycogen debranching enzyme
LRIYEDTHDLAFVSTMLPKLKKYFAWLASNRDFEGNGLLSIITPFESGMDWKPSFDPVVGFRHSRANTQLFWRVMWVDLRNFLRRYNVQAIYKADYFIVKEVGFNTLYVQDLHALARLCSLAQDNDANKFKTRAEQVTRSMLELMFDAEAVAFFDIYGHTMTKSKILTPTIFFPMVLPDIPESIGCAIVERHLFKKEEFQTPYPLPSVAVNDPAFDPFEAPIYLWRGPTWVVSNWFLYQCLLCNGYVEEANKLLETVKKLIKKSGFREYYHPFVGDGYGAKDFTWSGLVVDMMHMKEANQGQVEGRKAR